MQTRTSRLISIRKLVAWDIKLHGSRFILLEFGLGAPAMLIFGFWLTTINFSFLTGLYIFLIGINYFVLLSYAVSIARKNSVQSDIGEELPQPKAVCSQIWVSTVPSTCSFSRSGSCIFSRIKALDFDSTRRSVSRPLDEQARNKGKNGLKQAARYVFLDSNNNGTSHLPNSEFLGLDHKTS
jgi:hypothetical protein